MMGTTRGLLEYLLDLEDITGTNAERRLQEFTLKGKDATKPYAMKSTTGKPNIHAYRYTAEQLAFMKAELGPLLYFFGYTNHPTEENPNAYYHYEEHNSEWLDKYYRFRDSNQKMKRKVVLNSKQVRVEHNKNLKIKSAWATQYEINNAEEGFDLLTAESFPLLT